MAAHHSTRARKYCPIVSVAALGLLPTGVAMFSPSMKQKGKPEAKKKARWWKQKKQR
jgi:hypothetical protein